MSTTVLDVDAVRARFSALDRPLAFFDGPGRHAVPGRGDRRDRRLHARRRTRTSAAPYETSRRTDALVEHSRVRAAAFLGCTTEEVAFGPSMTSLNFLLTRAFGAHARRRRRGRRHAPRPRRERRAVARARARPRHRRPLRRADGRARGRLRRPRRRCSRSARASSRSRSPRTRSARRRTSAGSSTLAHEAGALAWADAVHWAPHGPIDVAAWDVDVLICSPYKFFGPHLGLAFGRRELLESWRPYKVRPAANEPIGHRFELGTLPHELLAGFVAAVDYVDSLGWDAIRAHESALGARFLAGLPDEVDLYGLRTMDGRVPTFCFNVPGRSPEEVATLLAERDLAVWHGNYYALEMMRHLGLPDGAVRAGIVHYNTEDGGRPAPGRARRARVKLLLLGGPKFLGRAVADAALERGHELTFFNRGRTNPELYPEAEKLVGRPRRRPRGARGPDVGRRRSTRAATSRTSSARRPRRSPARGSTASCRASRCTRTSASRSTRTAPSPSSATARRRARRRLLRTTARSRRSARTPSSDVFGDRALVVRPGLIVGPHDPTGRFTYWPHRIARGGEVLAPAPPERPTQFVDVRDLGEWMVDALRARRRRDVQRDERGRRAGASCSRRAARSRRPTPRSPGCRASSSSSTRSASGWSCRSGSPTRRWRAPIASDVSPRARRGAPVPAARGHGARDARAGGDRPTRPGSRPSARPSSSRPGMTARTTPARRSRRSSARSRAPASSSSSRRPAPTSSDASRG